MSVRAGNRTPPDLTGELSRISAPTLVVAGEDDFICGPASAREIAQGIAGARLVLIPDAGHMTYFEQPGRFVSELLTFLHA